jgi:hypothetical protein
MDRDYQDKEEGKRVKVKCKSLSSYLSLSHFIRSILHIPVNFALPLKKLYACSLALKPPPIVVWAGKA